MERRTDLAVEERELLGEDIKGVDYEEETVGGLQIERLRIRTERAGQLLKKPKGTYITAQLPPLTDNVRDTDERLLALSREIRRLLPVNGLVLVAGLGNVEITPDALARKPHPRSWRRGISPARSRAPRDWTVCVPWR